MQNSKSTAAVLRALKAMGLQLALDDFGTGCSSLSYLSRFPIDTLKIDRSFVRDLTTDPDDASIVRAVISTGKSLRMRVVAEGVETPAPRIPSGAEMSRGARLRFQSAGFCRGIRPITGAHWSGHRPRIDGASRLRLQGEFASLSGDQERCLTL